MEKGQPEFHNFALRSILFKGHLDWYVSYLKAERIAQVLLVLSDNVSDPVLIDATRAAVHLPESLAYFAAGERELPFLLADVFALTSLMKLAATGRSIEKENAAVLIAELEAMALRLGGGPHPSPFISPEDFRVPLDSVAAQDMSLSDRLYIGQKDISDTGVKGQTKGQQKGLKGHKMPPSQEQQERTAKVLEIVRRNTGVSVRDIAKEVHGCSEKTIQRELTLLIEQGLVKKTGERRWSVYFPTS